MALALVVPSIAWAQPDVDIVPDPQPAHPGQPYRIVYEVSWDGDPSEYAIWAELPEDVTVEGASFEFVESKGLVRDGRNVVQLVAELVPLKLGTFKTPPVTVHYVPEPAGTGEKDADPNAPPSPEPEEPTLRVEPVQVLVARDLTLLWVGIGTLATVAAVVSVIVLRRVLRKRRDRAPVKRGPSPAERAAAVEASMTKARQCRIDGQHYAFYGELARGAAALEGNDGALAIRLDGAAQRVGYTGETPTDDDMDSGIRELERALNAFREERGVR
ncbi:MAG: hypothetical protein GY851_11520 [bacterium]|nr:hypothetical protein [bacterium]